MEMLWIGLCFSALGFGFGALVFGAGRRAESSVPAVQSEVPAKPVATARFFSDRVMPAVPLPPQAPIEVLLRQIENHVRLEAAAAQSFVEFPSPDLLHCKTTSSLVN
jgi:hypothetical protein